MNSKQNYVRNFFSKWSIFSNSFIPFLAEVYFFNSIFLISIVFFYYLKINYEDQLAFFWVKLLGEVDKLLYSITFAVLDVLCMLTNSPCKFRVTLKPKFSSNRGNPHIFFHLAHLLNIFHKIAFFLHVSLRCDVSC